MLRRLSHLTAPAREPPQEGRQSKLRLLREAEIFRDLTPADMEDIERLTTMTTSRKGRVLYSADSSAEVLFILKKGRVQLYRIAEDGRRLLTDILDAGTVFGEMPMLSQRMGGSIAEALEDCTLCVISRHDLEHLIQSKPNFALNVVQLLALKNAELEERLERQAFQSVHERLASMLIDLARDSDDIWNVSHQQIGETIGASRETITRALGDFRAQGVLELSRSHIKIKDRRGLAEAARST